MRNDGRKVFDTGFTHIHYYYYLMHFEKKKKRKKESARIPPKPPGLTGFYSREYFFLIITIIIIIITFFKASAFVDQFFEGPVFDQHPSERTMIYGSPRGHTIVVSSSVVVVCAL